MQSPEENNAPATPAVPEPAQRRGVLATVDAGVRAFANFVTFGMADKLAAAGDTAIGKGTLQENLARQQKITDFDNEHQAGAVAVGEVAGAAVTLVTGAAAAKAAVKGTVAAAKATAQTARTTVATGAINAGANAIATGAQVTTAAVVRETAKVAAKETLKAGAKVVTKTAGAASKSATAGVAVAAAGGALMADELSKKVSIQADSKEEIEATGARASVIEQEMQRQKSVELNTYAAGAGLTIYGALKAVALKSPLGKVMNIAQKVAFFGGGMAGTTVVTNKVAEGLAEAEIAADVSHDSATMASGGAAALAAGGAVSTKQARSWMASRLGNIATDLKSAGLLGKGVKAFGLAGMVLSAVGEITSIDETVNLIRASKSEQDKFARGSEAQRAADAQTEAWLADPKTDYKDPAVRAALMERMNAEMVKVSLDLGRPALGEGQAWTPREEELFKKWAPLVERADAATEQLQAAAAVTAAASARAEVTPAYNERAERKPEGQRPAVTTAAAPARIGGAGLQVTPEVNDSFGTSAFAQASPATGQLRVTQAGYDGFGLGAPEAVAAAPTVHYDAFGSVISQPESQMAAAASATVSASLPAPPAAEPEAVDMGGVIDARLQLGPNGPAAKVDSTLPEAERVAAKRNYSPPSVA
jgi:hypothetical protein